MPKRLALALSASLLALPAEAEPVCTVTVYVWELRLEQVAAESGQPDLHAVAAALGSQAILRGGFRDPNRPKEPVRVELVGSQEGQGLRASLQSLP